MSSYSLWGAVFPLCVHPAAHNQASICDNPEPGVDPGRGLAVRADAGAHVGAGGGGCEGQFVRGTAAGTQGPKDTQSHTKSHDGGTWGRDSAETRRRKAGRWLPESPSCVSPAHTPAATQTPFPHRPFSGSSAKQLLETN